MQTFTIWQNVPHPGIRRKRGNNCQNGRNSLRYRFVYLYIDLHVLQHHSAADRWRYECAITSKHSHRRKVWRYRYENVHQHTIRACSNEILRRRENSFKERHERSSAIRTREGDSDTTFQTAYILHMRKMNNPYVRYLDQQQGRGMPVQGQPMAGRVYGQQTGYGLGSLFRSVARTVMPMVKSGAKALGNIALRSGANFVGDILASRNVKEAAKARTVEAANVAKRKAINKLRSQTGRGKRKRSKSVKRSRSVK
ncbi:Hypothetical predicted protein [Paramuricea clavata]|uniref:Uncharacterized protein n=1 Tax=Paramuricea clavata TaxID=317549 RepID=A0A7D9IB70_PARCT|nr:Hypothetical predicted protein [Paramuricea clavata]